MAKSLWGHYLTPETDYASKEAHEGFYSKELVVSKEFAQELERQRDYWKDKCEAMWDEERVGLRLED